MKGVLPSHIYGRPIPFRLNVRGFGFTVLFGRTTFGIGRSVSDSDSEHRFITPPAWWGNGCPNGIFSLEGADGVTDSLGARWGNIFSGATFCQRKMSGFRV